MYIMIFEGVITYIGPVESVGANAVSKCSFVLEENNDKQYKDAIMVDLLKDKTDLIKPYKVWDVIKVSLSTRVTEYNGRRYNNVGARKIEGTASWNAAAAKAPADDDLPF